MIVMGLKNIQHGKSIYKKMMLMLVISLLASCVPMAPKKATGKRNATGAGGSSGNLGSVDFGYGRVITTNPVVQSGNTNLSHTEDMANYVNGAQYFITTKATLTKDCNFSDIYTATAGGVNISDCFKVYLDTNSISQMTTTDARWSFDAKSDEFMQVQAYYHFNNAIDKMFDIYNFVHTHRINYSTSTFFSASTYQSAFVNQMATYNAFWDVGLNSTSTAIEAKTLTAYAKCSEAEDNAFFRPTDLSFCMGYSNTYAGVYTVHDPSVIYHEFGHFYVHTALNHRNTALEKITPVGSLTAEIKRRASLGYRFYDEAGAIGEAIADFFTSYITGRTHVFEWAFKFGYPATRPLSESDSIHKAGIGADSESRLRYPAYTDYDVHAPTDSYEDIHISGQIASHFFTTFSSELSSSCGYDATTSRKYVLSIITETLAELGTLSGQISDLHSGPYIYLNQTYSDEWQRLHTPITYRSFFQTFAKYAYGIISTNYCVAYTKDRLEKLLDDYGLLLFKNFNFDGNSDTDVVAAVSPSVGHTLSSAGEVNHSNRVKSVLLSKNLLGLSTDENDAKMYIVDSPVGMRQAVEGLRSLDPTTTLSPSLEGLPYNNGNGQVSPGEVVGIALNLFNKSNSDMAGVQVLANAWDHTAAIEDTSSGFVYQRPCTINNWPLSTEGGVSTGAQYNAALTLIDQGCDNVTTDNGVTATDKLAPICMMEWRDTNETRWVSQEEFLELSNMSANKCLYSTDKENCFMKPLNNAQEAWFSKIEAQKNYLQTFDSGTSSPTFNVGNIVIFEVSKEIMPGTKFMCRFRTRFTNCSDCYIDSTTSNNDDYLDHEYSGASPYKIISVDFMVIN